MRNDGQQISLDRKLNKINVWALAFGCIIGSGAFIMPGTTFLPSAGPLGTAAAMLLGAVVMLVIAMNYSYMIRKYPVAGGEFTYADAAFGRNHAYFCSWFLGLSYLVIVPFNATALGMVSRYLFGGIFEVGFHYQVAGYDVYMGEMLMAVMALLLLAFANICGVKIAGRLQTILACLMAASVIVIAIGAIISPMTDTACLEPLFNSSLHAADGAGGGVSEAAGTVAGAATDADKISPVGQILSVLALAPFCFVGFDTIPQAAEEFNFSPAKTKRIMAVAIFFGAFVYISNTCVAASVQPAGYDKWTDYINDLGSHSGLSSLPLFNAARELLGVPGLILVGTAVFCAMMTGMTGFYLGTSRLLYSIAVKNMLPAWFGRLHPKYRTPVNAIIFVLIISLVAPFFGRNALGWIVDMASFGGAVGFGYTSAAALKIALRDRDDKSAIVTGALGIAFSVVFAVLLLVPIPGLDCSLTREPYICLGLWTLLGCVFYVKMRLTLK